MNTRTKLIDISQKVLWIISLSVAITACGAETSGGSDFFSPNGFGEAERSDYSESCACDDEGSWEEDEYYDGDRDDGVPIESDPVPEGELAACLAPATCAQSCAIDIAARESDCPFETDFSTAVVDMAEWSRLTVRVTLDDPTDWAFHLGDSPSNNGFGGDSSDFTNDAEIQLYGNDLTVTGSDRSLHQPGRTREFPDIVPASGGVVEMTLGDAVLSLRVDGDPEAPMCFVQRSHDLLRLDAEDREGHPDRLWYLGMNQVYAGDRTGHGTRRVELCFE